LNRLLGWDVTNEDVKHEDFCDTEIHYKLKICNVTNYIVEHTAGRLVSGKTPEQVSKIKIIDPACGSGSFLLGAFVYLLRHHTDYYRKRKFHEKKIRDNPLTTDGNLTVAEKKRILLSNLLGVNIDANAVEVTKLSLLLKAMEGETAATVAH